MPEAAPICSLHWSDELNRFPEDALLRLAGFMIWQRPENGEAIWKHTSGALHVEADAFRLVLAQFGYTPADIEAGEQYWRHELSGIVHSQAEAVSMIGRKLKDYQRQGKLTGGGLRGSHP